MGRQPCCDKIGLKRGPWTIEEDHRLMSFILNNGIQCWRMVPKLAGLLRCGKSCRLRWINYLRPDLKRGAFSEAEENQIIELHARLGNRWSKIASHFPGRTDNEIKNHWNTRIKKRLKLQGLDPITHQPIEQKSNSELEKTESNSQDEQEKEKITIDSSSGLRINDEITIEGEQMDSQCETTFLIDNYELMCRNLDMDLWMMNQETNPGPNPNPNPNCYSPSFSLEESSSNYPNSNGDQSANCALQQWFERSSVVDSMLSWGCFNQMDGRSIFFPPT